MKRILIVSALLFGVTVLSLAQLSGSYNVGSGQTYTTLGAAISDLNSSTASASVTFNITSNLTEVGDVTVSTSAGLSASVTLTIKPSGGTWTITFPAANSFRTGGADYITIDGSTSGGTDQSLTIKNSGSSVGNSAIWVEGTSDNITIKNCIIGDATNTPDYGIRTSGASGNTIQNLTIQNNDIHGIGNAHAIVYLLYVAGTSTVTQNTITGDQTGGTQACGILVSNRAGTLSITKNIIYQLKSGGGSSSTLAAIKDSSSGNSGTFNIFNNFLGGSFAYSGAGNANYFVIDLKGNGARTIYQNTIAVNSVGVQPFDAAGLYIDNGTADFQNNIIDNNYNNGSSYCIYNNLLTPGNLTSDYNDLTTSGGSASIGYDGFSTYDPLSNWQSSAGSPDGNSLSYGATFTSSTDFHLKTGGVTGGDGDQNLIGTDLTSTVPDDIDGDTRRTGIQGPYKGADEGATALPVQLTSFTAVASRLDAVLRWSTATEVNNHGFDIERRAVSASAVWEKVGFVAGSGTSTSPKEYTYTDVGLPAGRYAYRIKQVDNNGSFTYSGAMEVEVGLAAKVLALDPNYPNPFNPSTNIAFTVPEDGKASLRIYNLLGQEVATLFDGVAQAGKIYQKTFDASRLPSGLYFSRLDFGGRSLMKKMLFVK